VGKRDAFASYYLSRKTYLCKRRGTYAVLPRIVLLIGGVFMSPPFFVSFLSGSKGGLKQAQEGYESGCLWHC
jgi:hypothetical protein